MAILTNVTLLGATSKNTEIDRNCRQHYTLQSTIRRKEWCWKFQNEKV